SQSLQSQCGHFDAVDGRHAPAFGTPRDVDAVRSRPRREDADRRRTIWRRLILPRHLESLRLGHSRQRPRHRLLQVCKGLSLLHLQPIPFVPDEDKRQKIPHFHHAFHGGTSLHL
ncbi:hypothetical protein PFISCL1PPCAC_23939, partial [Pristionchus fissidentatus]